MKRPLLLTAVLALTAVGLSAPPAAASGATRDVTAHLFQWQWRDVAHECRTTLGPAGYAAVQVTPPQEHVELPDQGYPWWQAYQPVSYKLDSRYGNTREFAGMVEACHRAGVEVYVDAVVNHMSGQTAGGTGSGGTRFGKYDYPGLYDTTDFHHCGRGADDWIRDWNDAWEIQHCELLGLADLATEQEDVRTDIAGYLNGLIRLGVDGFRIDAAKHIPAADLAAIKAKLKRPAYLYQEVLGNAPIPKSDYLPNGDVIEDAYGQQISRVVKSGKLSWLDQFGEAWGFSPSGTAVVYVDSHDTERDQSGATLTYKDGPLFAIGNVFSLAWPYGHPLVLSGFGFTAPDAGPPGAKADGDLGAVRCGGVASGPGGWFCQHRDTATTGMVGFRAAAGTAPVSRWWSDGDNAVAFAREGRGYVVLNRESTAVTRTFDTGLPAGVYCDVTHGTVRGDRCTGPTVTVGAAGALTTTVPGLSTLAIDVRHRVSRPSAAPAPAVSFSAYAVVAPGERLVLVGNAPALGAWDPAKGVPLSAAGYPQWTAQLRIPAGTAIEYKYVKVAADGTVTWESRPNRTGTVPADGWLSTSDGWEAGATVQATVTLHVAEEPGQQLYLVGAAPSIGSWNPADAVPLTKTADATWTGQVTLPGSAVVEYKYIRKDAAGTVVWESDPNRTVSTPSGGTIALDETWR
ncbi:alpha amylase C-terminal domain-containing protein [Dactylosporangium aurantiacum]|uniref:Alpha-amylase n=1 Tax=Dactylosporangium aurantiacum TaxID=35754 RepID=A0A9Q9MJR5_9ACTN|nr:carbohydrate-binding module family 20 domain-containing protein [Dactylosporangium aurantiacum]MDG6109792.1 carbohydrate-binding module family 20 domain-containing protein [Dactylosporangium aurantiacum]UWZ57175.1 alpha amylase C-terminal domain-containing protein [Dactylosporangium aurantiacum]